MAKKIPIDFEPTIVAVDTGGTFTDFFVISDEGVRIHKTLSTPQDPSRAILKGLSELKLRGPLEIIHGSTVATNALLEKKGARVALLTTAGFEDILEIGRQNRPQLYNLQVERQPALVPKKTRFGINERLSADGKILVPLTQEGLKKCFTQLKKSRVQAIAVCFLFSYRHAKHEQAAAKFLQKLKLPISLSSTICPEFREYERTVTTVLNAYVSPLMSRYLQRLRQQLPGSLRVMQSNGGSLLAEEAATQPVRTLLSGPAGGALGAWQIGRRVGISKILSFDMGGTSTDLCLIDGNLELTSEANIAGYPVKTPMLRLETIGAGGGSMAWQDEGGALRVGPQSAGADPGPIAYGRGGRHVTLTDANLYLGRIPPDQFLGGTMRVYPQRIQGPLKALAKSLKLSPEATAEGMLAVANDHMARALRVLSLQRGYDPRKFVLLPFGGAGALHACELADLLQIPRILVPTHPGVLSAYGMACSDWVRDYVTTVLQRAVSLKNLLRAMAPLKKQARQEAQAAALQSSQLKWKYFADLRYLGQSYEVQVPLEKNFLKNFSLAHRRLYGFTHGNTPIEVVNIRLQVRANPDRDRPLPAWSQARPSDKTKSTQKTFFKGRWVSIRIYPRSQLKSDEKVVGPALVTEYSATTYVAPGWTAELDRENNLLLERAGKR